MAVRGEKPVETGLADRSEDGAAVSRRGVMWRAGLATAAGAAALTVVGDRRADAATDDSLILGHTNDADATTELAPSPSTSPELMLSVIGAPGKTALSAVVASTETSGSAIAGAGVNDATGVSGSSGTGVGVAGSSESGTGVVGGSSAAGEGVRGQSISGTGVVGNSTKGVGVRASSTTGTALAVTGKVHFSRAGSATVAQGTRVKTVNVSGMTASSLVLVTLQKAVTGVYVEGAVPASGRFTVHLNKAVPTAMKFAWFVVSG